MSVEDQSREERIFDALEWISYLLDDLEIPFQVVGGLAATAYGSKRPLHDIDIYVPDGRLEKILPHVEAYHSHGPVRYQGDLWDCLFMEVHYAGEEIELADASRTWYRAGKDATWHHADIDFESAVRREIFGVEVPVIPREELVRYKRHIGRDVDLKDLAAIGAIGPAG